MLLLAKRTKQASAGVGAILAKAKILGLVTEKIESGVTVDDLIGELDDMLKLAKRVKHPAAGVGAVLAKGKLLGLIVDKAEIEGTIRKPAREATAEKTMTMDEWQEKFSPRSTETLQ